MMFRFAIFSVLSLWVLTQIALVNGHAYFSAIGINGQMLQEGDCMRPHPGSKYDYPISSIDDPSGLQSADMTCGHLPSAGRAANRKCSVAPGSQITIQWHYEMGMGNSDTFIIDPSHKGPCLVYMAKSETGAGAVWFKIFEDGYNPTTKKWCVDTLRANGGRFTVTLPTDITPGNYLFRAELLTLHEGFEVGGVQPYVHCAELAVTGSGTSNPTGLVSIPGVYQARDPGIYFNIYDGFRSYPIPGPPVYVSGSGSGGSSSSSSSSTTGRRATTARSSTSTSTSTSTSGRSSTSTSTSGRSSTSTSTSGRSSTSTSTSGRSSTSTSTTGASSGMCYLPGTPNLNGTINSNPKYCGKNSRRARCADGQCCSRYGYCGPVADSNGRYYEEVNGVYKELSQADATNLYCKRNQGDYRLYPCSQIDDIVLQYQQEEANDTSSDNYSSSGASDLGSSVLLIGASLAIAAVWDRFRF